MATTPTSVRIRTYQVGFGDCFLLTFNYPNDKRHVLIDFGSTGVPEGAPKNLMMMIAEDIMKECGGKNGKLHAVVATHRHKDHISGFETRKGGKGTGDIIAALKPEIVIQPWTEDPKLAKDATGPSGRAGSGGGSAKALAAMRIQSLAAMQSIAAAALKAAKSPQYRFNDPALKEIVSQLRFIGEDNIANPSAVKNLMSMARNNYVNFGADSRLGSILPGVNVRVLGPPTLKQEAGIAKQRARDRDEFWHIQQGAMALTGAGGGKPEPLFPRHVVGRAGSSFPIDSRWLIYHARQVQASQSLQIVRILDKAMNNTSVILLFEVGKQLLLFPGDAQIENWSYALEQKGVKAALEKVSVYKVGHHGSLNATPKSLWENFELRDKTRKGKKQLVSLMSTMAGKHGHEDSETEVPRAPLVNALDAETKLFTTQSLRGDAFYHDELIAIAARRVGARPKQRA